MTVSATDQRPYDVADAILTWLHSKLRAGNRLPRPDLPDLMATASWQGEPITQGEWDQATLYLRDRGLIDGQGTWGGGILRPKLTVSGQDLVALGQSCRPSVPAAPAPASGNHFTINNNAPSQVAINSADFTQTLNVGTPGEKLAALADLLDRYATTNPVNHGEIIDVAADVREIAAVPEHQRGPIQSVLGRVISSVGLAMGTEIGQQITTLAVDLLSLNA
ncbi:hypothetical protein [Nocardia salmonicida]|uniref:hypothetical protein n=1 Tax=Nocardia salmonicida TaxID=53431 RepID=UPI0037950CD6